MQIAAQNLIRPFTGQDNFVTSFTYRPAQQVFGHTVRINAQRLRLQYRVCESICQIVLLNGNRKEFSLRLRRHFLGNFSFVVFRTVECQRKRADRALMVPCRKAQNCAGIDSTAEITTDRNIGA